MRQKKFFAIGNWSFPLVGGKARVKEFTVSKIRGGFLLKQPLHGSYAELVQVPVPPGGGGKKLFRVRLNMPNVFGLRKVVTIGTDWVQIGDRIFKAAKPISNKPIPKKK